MDNLGKGNNFLRVNTPHHSPSYFVQKDACFQGNFVFLSIQINVVSDVSFTDLTLIFLVPLFCSMLYTAK